MSEVSVKGAKVLVTGASGFLGSHLCRRLLAAGAEVHATSRSPRAPDGGAGVQWHSVDLCDFELTRALVRELRPELVFHLAGYPVGAQGLEHVLVSFRSNLMTTVHLLCALADTGCQRLVLAGSLEEPDEGVPGSPYATAKLAGSAYAQMFHALYALPVVYARISIVYGPGPQDERKLVPHVIRSLLGGKAPELGSGRREVDWIYVEDAVDGLLAAATAADVEGASVDIGSGELVSVRRLVERIAETMGAGVELRFGGLSDRPLELVGYRVADTARSGRLLGWAPRTSLDEGLQRTIAWFATDRKPGA